MSKPEEKKQLSDSERKLHDKVLEIQAKFLPESTPYAVCEDVIESITGQVTDEPYVPDLKDNHERLAFVAAQYTPDSLHMLLVRDAQDLLAGKKIRRRLKPVQHVKLSEPASPAPDKEPESVGDKVRRISALNPAVARGFAGGGVPVTNQRGFIEGAE